MKTITLYNPAELKEENPEGFERAHDWYKNNYCDEIPWQNEIMDSLKAIFKASGIALRDYSIGVWGYSYVRFDMESDTEDLSGNRALAWLENNLLDDLRIPEIPMFTRFTLPNGEITEYQPTKRGDLSQYGQYYRAGMIKPCPFTGVCFDEDFLESLQKSIKDGDTIKEAYENLASVAVKLFEAELEQAQSEEEFLMQEHLEFDIDGHHI